MKKFVSVIITAAGLGRRFDSSGTELPKQFHMIKGVPILSRTVAAFDRMERVDEIIVTLPAGYLIELPSSKISAVITGGTDRQQSVYEALRRVSKNADIVLIHDGVRPFVTERCASDVIRRAEEGYAAVAGVRPADTVKQTDGGGTVVNTPDRDTLWLAQTPQGFTYDVITQAHELAERDGYKGTDDCMLVERYKLAPVKIVEGDAQNIKITTKQDLIFAEMFLN
jgi:2-C-methyl-D-erythritol 4-phosphate cytidylyltransferase